GRAQNFPPFDQRAGIRLVFVMADPRRDEDVFKDIGRFFHQDVFLIYTTIDEAAAVLVRGWSEEQRTINKARIERLLETDIAEGRLIRLFTNAGAQVFFSKMKMREFLALIVQKIDLDP